MWHISSTFHRSYEKNHQLRLFRSTPPNIIPLINDDDERCWCSHSDRFTFQTAHLVPPLRRNRQHPDGNRARFRLFIHVVRQNLPLGGITCLVGAVAGRQAVRETNKRWMHSNAGTVHGCSLEDAFRCCETFPTYILFQLGAARRRCLIAWDRHEQVRKLLAHVDTVEDFDRFLLNFLRYKNQSDLSPAICGHCVIVENWYILWIMQFISRRSRGNYRARAVKRRKITDHLAKTQQLMRLPFAFN